MSENLKPLIFFLLRICMNKISITRINKYAESGSPWRVQDDNEKYLVVKSVIHHTALLTLQKYLDPFDVVLTKTKFFQSST